jgi:hypothetical protein
VRNSHPSLRRLATSILLGTLFSIALAALGPLVLPTPYTDTYAGALSYKYHSWLATSYTLDSGQLRATTTTDAAAHTRSLNFPLTRLQYLMAGFPTSWPNSFRLLDSGFPFRALTGRQAGDSIDFDAAKLRHTVVIPGKRFGVIEARPGDPFDPLWKSWIPYTPIWPGFLLNIAIWSFAVWLALTGRANFTRLLRSRKGLCPTCAYDLRATPPPLPCPECGHTSGRRG